MLLRLRLLCLVFCSSMNFTVLATDVECQDDVNSPPSASGAIPTRTLASITSAPVGEVRSTLSKMLGQTRPLQQVNVKDSVQQARNVGLATGFSPAEDRRRTEGKACDVARDALLATFQSHRHSMGFPEGVEGISGLALFLAWYLDPLLPEQNRKSAMPVVDAEKKYARDCLVSEIPAEMNSELIRKAVGILSFEGQPFCTAFRSTRTTVITAKHCFFTQDGRFAPQTISALSKRGKIWFQYEEEPSNRYQVCPSTLPKIASERALFPSEDSIQLTVGLTPSPVAPWTWSTAAPGASLYLRAYFPFTESDALDIEKLRATAHGGCAAIAARGRCVFNACQSAPIMSGAPVFLRPELGNQSHILNVVGIHLGAASVAGSGEGGGGACDGLDGQKLNLSNFSYQPEGMTP